MDPAATIMWLRFREEYRASANEEWEWFELGTFASIKAAEEYAEDYGREIADSRSWCERFTWHVEEQIPEDILKQKIIDTQGSIERQTERINRYKKILMGF